MEKNIKIFHWLPRLMCILAIFFISLFAADSFSAGLTIWQQLGAFAIHLIPSFVLIILLLIAWKWEFIGGLIFILIGLGLSPFVYIQNYQMNHSVWMSLGIIASITMPFVIVGILFIISNCFKKKYSKN
ncbi:MAG: hypothetical protein IMY72_14210 [Bacteroidetes bacterium]|nr:hypothetical protein [Bacteroidota bacterium]